MKLLVILTGGTIGSGVVNGFITPGKNIKDRLLSDLIDFKIDTLQPYTILSEQLNGEHLNKLIECINCNLNKGYDGIIVTHGTDTLQYTSCALSCAFGSSKIPIVLVSSNYILDDERANGKENFKYAVKFVKEKIGGVFVSYKNTGSKPEIHQGHKVLPHEIYTDDVKSIGNALGYYENDKFVLNHQPERCPEIKKLKFSKNSSVLWIKFHPGTILPGNNKYKAILLEGYHSGTLPTLSSEFRNFCENTSIPIFLVGAKEGTQYESVKEYEELGIKHLPFISPIYAYIRLWIGINGKENSNKAYKDLCNVNLEIS